MLAGEPRQGLLPQCRPRSAGVHGVCSEQSAPYQCCGPKEQTGCALLTATQGISQSPGVSLAACRGYDLASGSLSALAVTIVNSRSIVRSLWLFITSLFAGASARRSIDSEMAGQLITVLKQGSLTSSAQLQGTLMEGRARSRLRCGLVPLAS